MGLGLTDITLYSSTPHKVGTPKYWEETSLKNFLCDLYHQKMNGYKPPKTSRITIQPSFHGVWKQPGRFGSIVHVAPKFDYEKFNALSEADKFRYLLEVIHDGNLQLCDYYSDWDRSIFETAYKEVLACNFRFIKEYSEKLSRDKTKKACITIEKSPITTSVFAKISIETSVSKIKLFDKKNMWCYDSCYILAQHCKWFDFDRFGIHYKKGTIDIWYSIGKNEVFLLENGDSVQEIDFKKYFLFG